MELLLLSKRLLQQTLVFSSLGQFFPYQHAGITQRR